ncbi:MAG: c-type cytochrome [Sulfurimonas sp.]|uniref:c-type cytochrome n=1 Tax=Sulfurimonas sp. TaxID=2022749 RepID=UPI00263943DE|nr:c-type cytochrome [Sulfurimonas sp.]MDD2652146.1 c-type cytochrome [Sulfurimonas sp.]MDD3450571.1 c-type cytochrome [Sulfurimonas sp.]
MKNIIVGILTLVIAALMAYTASQGRAYHGGEHSRVIEDIGADKNIPAQASISQATTQQMSQPQEKSDREKEDEQLKAIKDKAGNVGEIKVSTEYKSKCAACHGANGSGEQDGRKLMGPKLYGQSAEKLYKDLVDFKAGRKENIIMKGLLINTSEEELKRYADEIGAFHLQQKQ